MFLSCGITRRLVVSFQSYVPASFCFETTVEMGRPGLFERWNNSPEMDPQESPEEIKKREVGSGLS